MSCFLPMNRPPLPRGFVSRIIRLLLLLGTLVAGTSMPAATGAQPPNILFIVMDDVGIDQLTLFNPNATNWFPTPNIDSVA